MTTSGRLWWLAAWAWCAIAGGGGLWLLITTGPWTLTNGWYALCSGISACPLTGALLRRLRVPATPRAQCIAALSFFIAGHIHRWLQP